MSVATARRETGLLAELTGICGIAITQPVVTTFGDAPEHLAFRGAGSASIIAFPFLVALIPAVGLWLPGAVTRIRFEAAGRATHIAAVALVAYAGALQFVYRLTSTEGTTKLLLSVAGAGLVVLLFRRFEAVRMWTRAMSVLSLAFVVLFLFGSAAGELAFADPPEPVVWTTVPPSATPDDDPPEEPPIRFPDIVMIVLDELPTALLLDEAGGIDEVRYPNLAQFAEDATWYRSFTSVSGQTLAAIPAVLNGRYPDERRSPVWTAYPDTLFRLLGGTYHLVVSEGSTKLCPETWCGSELTPPPPPATTAPPAPAREPEPAPTTTTTTPPQEPQNFDRGGIRRLLGDALDIWRQQIALDRRDVPEFIGFEESVVVVPPAPTAPPTSSTTTTTPTSTTAPAILDSAILGDEETLELTAVGSPTGQLPRIDDFRAAIAPSSQPALYYLHLVLPHRPFIFTETGSQYSGPPSVDAAEAEWEDTILAARSAIQMQFTDRLVGDVLDSVRDAGLYDDAIVIVTADHGASLDTASHYRYYDGTNAPAVMVTPFLMKQSRQSAGAAAETQFETVDVLPTLADQLRIEIPWPVDGRSVLDPSQPPRQGDAACEDQRRYVRLGVGVLGDDDDIDTFELCAADLLADGLEPALGAQRRDDEWTTAWIARTTPFADLLGVTWAELGAVPGGGAPVTLYDAESVLGGASPPAGVIRGTVPDDSDAEWIVVSVDGQVVGISPVYDREAVTRYRYRGETTTNQFTVLIPSALIHSDGYDVRVASVEMDGTERIVTELPVQR